MVSGFVFFVLRNSISNSWSKDVDGFLLKFCCLVVFKASRRWRLDGSQVNGKNGCFRKKPQEITPCPQNIVFNFIFQNAKHTHFTIRLD